MYTTEYYSVVKMNKTLLFVIAGMEVEIMLS